MILDVETLCRFFMNFLMYMVESGDDELWKSENTNMEHWTFEEDCALAFIFWIQMSRISLIMKQAKKANGVQSHDADGDCTGCIGCMAYNDFKLPGNDANLIKVHVSKVQNGELQLTAVPYEWIKALLEHFPDSLNICDGIFLRYFSASTKRFLLNQSVLESVKDIGYFMMGKVGFEVHNKSQWDEMFEMEKPKDCRYVPVTRISSNVVGFAIHQAKMKKKLAKRERRERDKRAIDFQRKLDAEDAKKCAVAKAEREKLRKAVRKQLHQSDKARKWGLKFQDERREALRETVTSFVGSLSYEEKRAMLFQNKVDAEWTELKRTREKREGKGIMSGYGKKKVVKRRRL